jgi:phospholipase/carboxylesterase
VPLETETHAFLPGSDDAVPVVLLHGSGGTETSLLPLAPEVAPGSKTLALRGTLRVGRGHAFLQRLADGRVDEADLEPRIPGLARSLTRLGDEHGFARRPVAIGFSNGAIMAAALLVTHPDLLAGAILLRPLSPFDHDLPGRLDGTPVLIIDGETDARRSPGDGLRLAARLRRAGALVAHHVLPTGHALTSDDTRIAREWLRSIEL